ncbi:MAG: bifunctional 5,10-methylenetetrahydrofolate dehydrogenase/5,10-methenyltetrahydrofolate cyclohydrolase [Brevinemataceae bacterium]
MSAIILDGKKLSDTYYCGFAEQLKTFPKLNLSVILIGNDPASHTYVAAKIKACKKIGIDTNLIHFDQNCTEDQVLKSIDCLNKNKDVHGMLVQLPVPKHIDTFKILNAIDPHKDVDCFNPVNLGLLFSGESQFAPATPTGVMMLIDTLKEQWKLESQHVVMVGASNIVGKPMSILLLNRGATVTIAHAKTKNLSEICLNADMIISAVGKPSLIGSGMVKPRTVLIDVGINKIADNSQKGYRLTGDMDFENLKENALAITPVPRGVGPMTIAALIGNLIYLYRSFHCR